jgi:hypothetical protein
LRSFRAWLLAEAEEYSRRIDLPGDYCDGTQEGRIQFGRFSARRGFPDQGPKS